jgi:hypothetical protein
MVTLQAVIASIKREKQGVFFWNWVQEISVMSKEAWQHAPFAINPADLPSHGYSDNCYNTDGGWASIAEVATRKLVFWITRAR